MVGDVAQGLEGVEGVRPDQPQGDDDAEGACHQRRERLEASTTPAERGRLGFVVNMSCIGYAGFGWSSTESRFTSKCGQLIHDRAESPILLGCHTVAIARQLTAARGLRVK
jgi:hypothetical protein